MFDLRREGELVLVIGTQKDAMMTNLHLALIMALLVAMFPALVVLGAFVASCVSLSLVDAVPATIELVQQIFWG